MSNITWHDQGITREDRNEVLGHKSAVLWFTGLSGSGKSTIASALQQYLLKQQKATYVLDGDNVRHGLNKDLGFGAKDREENIRRIGEVAHLFHDAGIITLVSFISPYQKDRNAVREKLGEHFVEIFVDCPLDYCEQRDPKGLYKKARAGEINNFTGISAPYEKPNNPEISIDTSKVAVNEAVEHIVAFLKQKEII